MKEEAVILKVAKAEAPAIIKSKKDRESEWKSEEITFEFFNLEEPGVAVKFVYGPANRAKTYTLLHGGRYTHSRDLVQHLESRQVPIWGYRPDGRGAMGKNLEGHKSRFQCRQIFV